MMTRRDFTAACGASLLLAHPCLAAAQARGGATSRLLPGTTAEALLEAFGRFPFVQQDSGVPIFVITRKGCAFSHRMVRDYPMPPDPLHMAYVVIPTADTARRALLRFYADPTPESFLRFMRGDYDQLGTRLSPAEDRTYVDVVQRWRAIERALATARMRAVTPMFFFGRRSALYTYNGYERELVEWLRSSARAGESEGGQS